MKRYLLLSLCCVFLSCGDTEESNLTPASKSLSEYITSNASQPLVRDSLIACAAGGQVGFMENEEYPISIFYYPEGNATEFRYFETENATVNPDDLSQYKTKVLPDAPILNGYLRHFSRAAIEKNIWCRVSFIKDDHLHISNAIRLKYNDLPTEFNPELLSVDQTESLSPNFIWEDGRTADNAIYFQVVNDNNDNLISGTYTFERQFQFYNLENVVLNIRDVNPAPKLQSNEDYKFLLMGVSADNWVNLIIEKPFSTR